jgi:hypothetical protein
MFVIILAASLMPAKQASMSCTNASAVQTVPVRGPGGYVAALKVSSEDDHSKDSHQCNAYYRLLLTSKAGDATRNADLLTSNGDYSRSLSLRLSGFSQDGKRVLGILSERGKYPFTMLFDYSIADSKVKLVDIRRQFAPIVAANCSSMLDVIGTSESGRIVLRLNSQNQCGPSGLWLLGSPGGRPQRLPQSAPFLGLYQPETTNP